ncbi:MAG: zinc ribbon domain-containing protein [Thermoplasmata archaeon]
MAKKIRDEIGGTFCSSCGKSVDEDDLECSNCGGSLDADIVEEMECLSCGFKSKINEEECPICGGNILLKEGESEAGEVNTSEMDETEGTSIVHDYPADLVSLDGLYKYVEERENELTEKLDEAEGDLKKHILDEIDNLGELKVNILEMENYANYQFQNYLSSKLNGEEPEVVPEKGKVSPEEWMAEQRRIQHDLFKIKNTVGTKSKDNKDSSEDNVQALKRKTKKKEKAWKKKITELENELESAKKLDIDIREIKEVLIVLDDLLGGLPDEKIEQFAKSKDFELYDNILEKLDI